MLPVLWTIRMNVAMPGLERGWVAGLNSAARPNVPGMARSADAAPWMAGLLAEVAIAMRFKLPCTAKSTAPVVIGTT